MNIHFRGVFYSIKDFEWNNIPELAILTGRNGSGKTQFLRLLYNMFSTGGNAVRDNFQFEKDLQGREIDNYVTFEIDGYNFKEKNSLLLLSHGKSLPNPLNHKINYKAFIEVIQWICHIATPREVRPINYYPNGEDKVPSFHDSSLSNTSLQRLFSMDNIDKYLLPEIQQATGKKRSELKQKDIICHFPLGTFFRNLKVSHEDFVEVHAFFYHYKKIYRERFGLSVSDMGQSPIDVLNSIFAISKLPYTVLPFNESEYLDADFVDSEMQTIVAFKLQLINLHTNSVIEFSSLSSGERIIASLGLIEYHSEYNNNFPDVILLDEIDAHLHPSLIPNLFRVVDQILIQKCGARVIMATHNPSTVALAPKTERCGIFLIENNPHTQISKDESANRVKSINLLTEGLVIVDEKTKYIFVEDEDDVKFYSSINDHLEVCKNVVFLPASNRINGKTAQTGGKDAVKNWVDRFSRFSDIFSGLIDRDSGANNEALNKINRYSIENYLADPLVLFSFLNAKGCEETKRFHIIPGTENKILNQLQKCKEIIDFIVESISTKIFQDVPKNRLDELLNTKEVKFVNGAILIYPDWIFEVGGKKLYKACDDVFRYHPSNEQLLYHFMRLEMIPEELITTIKNSCL